MENMQQTHETLGSGGGKSMWTIVAILVLALGAWALATRRADAPKTEAPAQVAESVKFGFVGPLTGDVSSIGTVARAAAELAVEEVNAAGGVLGKPLVMIYEDGKCNATVATNAVNKLINSDKVTAIVGGLCSTETAAFGPSAMDAKKIVMSYGSSAPGLSQLGQYFFRDYPSDAFQGKFAAEYAYDVLGARKVSIVYHISEWGTGIKNVFSARFKELGGEILTEDGTSQDGRDYRTILAKVKSANPDIIYMPMYPDGGTIAVRQAYDLGIRKTILGGDAWADPKFQGAVSGKGDILLTEAVGSWPDDFVKKIMDRTGGTEVTIGTPHAYDAVKILAQTINTIGSVDPDKIQAALRDVTYDGVSGTIDFDQNGDVTVANYVVKKIVNGKAEVVK